MWYKTSKELCIHCECDLYLDQEEWIQMWLNRKFFMQLLESCEECEEPTLHPKSKVYIGKWEFVTTVFWDESFVSIHREGMTDEAGKEAKDITMCREKFEIMMECIGSLIEMNSDIYDKLIKYDQQSNLVGSKGHFIQEEPYCGCLEDEEKYISLIPDLLPSSDIYLKKMCDFLDRGFCGCGDKAWCYFVAPA